MGVQILELSDGQRALIVLYALTFLTAGQGRVLLIDEPFNYALWQALKRF